MFVHQQFATDSGFTTGLVDYYTEIQGNDWEATSATIGGGASVGISGAAQTFVQPTGTYYTRCRFETNPGDTSNNSVSGWSNTITDTITTTTTVWTTTTGTNKNTNISVSGSPALVCLGTSGFGGAPCGVRATAAVTGKRHFEVTITNLAGSEAAYIGIEDGTSTLGPAVYPNPPTNFTGYRTDGAVYKNGSVVSGATAAATNDVVEIEFDTSAATLTVWLNGVSQAAVTGLLASNYYAFNSTCQASTLTANFGQNTFIKTPTSGYTGFP
jgi:hypothetical protein